MRRVRFGPDAARPFSAFGSSAHVAPVAAVNGQLFIQGLHIPPGGTLARHRGRLHYVLLVTEGSGWISTDGGERESISAGDAITWPVSETREIGSDEGLSAVWVQYALGGMWGPKRRFAAGGTDWTVYLEAGNELEQRACDQLERLLNTYDLSRWTFTSVIRICDFAIPHSHPILTLNTRHLDDDEQALSTFVHEQIHWFEEAHPAAVAAAVAELRGIYPDAPGGLPAGAHDLDSTYLHLVVCPLEYAALTAIIGPDAARRTLQRKSYYTWVYERTLADWERIHTVLSRHGLEI